MNLKSSKKIVCLPTGLSIAFLFAMFTLYAVICLAGPVASIMEEFTQPDGSVFEAIQRGDEWQHWYETKDGYTIIEDRATGWWYYAKPDNEDSIKKGEYVVGKDNPENYNIKKGLRPKARKHDYQLPQTRHSKDKDKE